MPLTHAHTHVHTQLVYAASPSLFGYPTGAISTTAVDTDFSSVAVVPGSPNHIVLGSYSESTVGLYDFDKCELVSLLLRKSVPIHHVSVSHDGALLYVSVFVCVCQGGVQKKRCMTNTPGRGSCLLLLLFQCRCLRWCRGVLGGPQVQEPRLRDSQAPQPQRKERGL